MVEVKEIEAALYKVLMRMALDAFHQVVITAHRSYKLFKGDAVDRGLILRLLCSSARSEYISNLAISSSANR